MRPQGLSGPRRQMKILDLGLPRSGTLSMVQAFSILGYQNICYSLHLDLIKDDPISQFMSRAAAACLPVLPSYTGDPLSRKDWDTILGDCEAALEFAAIFAPQLIDAYPDANPDAKVVVVVRDFDSWFRSLDDAILTGLWSFPAEILVRVFEPFLGICPVSTFRKTALGFLDASDLQSARENARMVYERHHRFLREKFDPARIFFYRLGDGWAPLCEFLGKPVPSVEFPHINDSAQIKKDALKLFLSRHRHRQDPTHAVAGTGHPASSSVVDSARVAIVGRRPLHHAPSPGPLTPLTRAY